MVGRGAPFHCTCAPDTKPVPFTVRVKAGPPAAAAAGLRVVMAGGALIGNAVAAEDVLPDVTTTLALPALAIRLAETYAVN